MTQKVTDRNSTTEEGPCEMGAIRGAEGRILEESREEELGQTGEGDWITGEIDRYQRIAGDGEGRGG